MFNYLKKLLVITLLTFIISVPAKAETVLNVTDWQAGVVGITDSYAEFITNFEAANPGVKVEYTQYTFNTYLEYLKPALSSLLKVSENLGAAILLIAAKPKVIIPVTLTATL